MSSVRFALVVLIYANAAWLMFGRGSDEFSTFALALASVWRWTFANENYADLVAANAVWAPIALFSYQVNLSLPPVEDWDAEHEAVAS